MKKLTKRGACVWEVTFSICDVDLISATFWENNIFSPGERFGSPPFAIGQQDELHVYKFNFANFKLKQMNCLCQSWPFLTSDMKVT